MQILLNKKGATLVELMAAVSLFAIVLASFLTVCTQGIKTGGFADNAYLAYNLAKNRIETLKSISFNDLSLAGETNTFLDKNGVPDLDGNYKRSTSVATSYQADPNLTQVTVSVYYKYSGQWTQNPVQIATVIYNGS